MAHAFLAGDRGEEAKPVSPTSRLVLSERQHAPNLAPVARVSPCIPRPSRLVVSPLSHLSAPGCWCWLLGLEVGPGQTDWGKGVPGALQGDWASS